MNNHAPTHSPEKLKQSLESGIFHDGLPAKVHILTNQQGMNAVFMDIGATWVSAQVPVSVNESREVVLGMSSLQDYLTHTSFLGATIGRFANRIDGGKFSINGHHYQIDQNNNGNSLHGGAQGFDKKRWLVKKATDSAITYTLHSPDGEQGFPGNLDAKVTYTLTEQNQISIEYFAICDQDCPINLTNHAYFNLDGAESGHTILDHHLQLLAEAFLPTNDEQIPTGELKSVTGTGFDFNHGKTIASDLLKDEEQIQAKGYDHAFLFSTSPHHQQLNTVAHLTSSDQILTMTVLTDKPAIQLYTGNFLAGTPSRTGVYKKHQGIALETQFLPNSPNQADWAHIQPLYIDSQKPYQFQTIYKFTGK